MEEHIQLQLDFNDYGDEIHIIDSEAVETSNTSSESKTKLYTNKCKHSVRIKSFKKDYLSYCSKCGKILSVKHKKGE